jgi:dolichol kinase
MQETYADNGHTLSFKGELQRKLIHIVSSVIPIGYFFLDRWAVLSILLPILLLMLAVEAAKYKSDLVYRHYTKFFKHMLKGHEIDRNRLRLNGASWVLLADILCILLFPKLAAITGMLMLSLADSFSGIAGRLFGKKLYAPNRSYAGTITFFVVGAMIIFLTPKYFYSSFEYALGIIVVLLTTVADSMDLPADDNFVIPIVSSALFYILYIIFFPGIFSVNP